MWCSAVGSIVTLLLSLLVVPLAAEAQPLGKVYRIGYLGTEPHRRQPACSTTSSYHRLGCLGKGSERVP
jgi:hypothetical protein